MTLALSGKTRRRQLWLLSAALIAVVAATLFAVGDRDGLRRAYALTLGSATGTWDDVVLQDAGDGDHCVPPFETFDGGVEIRWGNPSPGDCDERITKSGYRFDGASGIEFEPDELFELGDFTHFNQPIEGGTSITAITLTVELDFDVPDETVTLEFDFSHDETPNNTGSGDPCPYGGNEGQGVNINGCADQVVVTTPVSQMFTIGATTYTLDIIGFIPGACATTEPDPGNIQDTFVTAEDADNPACIFAKITQISASITIEKSNDTTGPVEPGTAVNYSLELTVVNGPLEDVDVVDDLPAGIGAPVSAISNGGLYSGGDGGTITWDNLDLPTGVTTLTYTATVQDNATEGDYVNTATITHVACESIESDCEDDSTVTVAIPSIVIVKTNDTTGPVLPGTVVAYELEITVVNGPLEDVDVVDDLPAGIGAPVSLISNGGIYSGGDGGTITWSDLDLPSGVTTLTYSATVQANATDGDYINVARITHDVCEAGDSDCEDDSTVTVDEPEPDITVDKSGPSVFTPGDIVSFTIVVTNAGPGTADNVILTDTLPSAAPSWDVGGPDAGDCAPDPVAGGAMLTCSLGAIEEDGTRTITLTGTTTDTDVCAPIVNTANVTAENEVAEDVLPNSDTHTVACVLGTGNLVIRKVLDYDGNRSEDPGDDLDDGWDVEVVCTEPSPIDDTFTTGDNGPGTIILTGLDEGTVCTVTEDPNSKPGHVVIGFNSVDAGGSDTGAGTQAVVTISDTVVAEVDFFNQPQGSITVNKTTLRNGANEPSQNGGWEITIEGCGITDSADTVQGNPHGSVTFSNLPACPGGYDVTEDANSKAGANPPWSPSGGTQRDVDLDAGENAVVTFTNVRNDPTPTVPPPTETQPPPTNTPTNMPTPTNTPTNTPTATPTNTPPAAPVTEEAVAAATPAPPETGSGVSEGLSGSTPSLFMAVAGLLTIAGAFVLLASHRGRGRQ